MALGSIEHLQHYFTKTGIAARRNANTKPHLGLVPAIGGPTHIRTTPSSSISSFVLPPSPDIPTFNRPAFPPSIKTFDIDPDSLLHGVVEDLSAVAQIWQLETLHSDPDPAPIDVLSVLKTTTRTIRSIRNYLVSLPDESAGTIRAKFRRTALGPPTATATTMSSKGQAQPDPLTLIRRSALEVLTVLRAVEEACRLPLSDDAYDAQSDPGSQGVPSTGGLLVASPSARSVDLPRDDHSSDGSAGLHTHDFAADVAVTFMQVQGRSDSIPVWYEEEDDSFVDEKEKREHWDERLDVRSGWLYRQDVTLKELERERKVVGSYLDVVDEVLFGWKRAEETTERGWEKEKQKVMKEFSRSKGRRASAFDGGSLRPPSIIAPPERRRVSTGMLQTPTLFEEPESIGGITEEEEIETVDDEDLPEWARRSSFANDDLGRAHALLRQFLPTNLLPALVPPSPRSAFLNCLSSGQLLCAAYNSCVRKSKQPWGYVSQDDIHDIITLEKVERDNILDGKAGEGGGKKVWTFRRTDNLRLWIGALKLRYMLPVLVPPENLPQLGSPGQVSPLPSPKRATFRSTEPMILFDAKVVARKDDGWEDMLETVLLSWVWKAVDERRRVQ